MSKDYSGVPDNEKALVLNKIDGGEDEEEEETGLDEIIGGLFKVTKPRDFKNGLSHAGKNLAAGIGIGLISLVAMPVEGVKEEGAWGFVKGTAKGIAAAVAAPVAGVGTGIYQLARGVGQQVEANDALEEGKVWDKVTREWVFAEPMTLEECLDKAKREVEAENESKNVAGHRFTSKVVNTHFYDVLGVSPEATKVEIKKAYYLKAREEHPDKAVNKEEAKVRFQEIIKAYEVLMDDEARKVYNTTGDSESMLKDVPIADVLIVMFGSEKFMPFTGELNIPTTVESLFKIMISGDEEPNSMEITSLFSEGPEFDVRAINLAIYLRQLIEEYVDFQLADACVQFMKEYRKVVVEDMDKKERRRHDAMQKLQESLRIKYPKEAARYPGKPIKLDKEILLTWHKRINNLAKELLEGSDDQKRELNALYMGRLSQAYVDTSSKYKRDSGFFDGWSTSSWSDYMTILKQLLSVRSEMNLQAESEKKILECEKRLKEEQSPKKIKELEEKIQKAREKSAFSANKTASAIIDFLMTMNLQDIEKAAHKAVVFLCSDTSVSILEREIRGEAISIVGTEFKLLTEKCLESKSKDLKIDWTSHLADAMSNAAMNKARKEEN